MRLRGLPAAPGTAAGPVWVWRPTAGNGREPSAAGAAPAALTLDEAAAAAARQLDELAGRLRGLGRPQEAEILEAQAMMATDPTLLDAAQALAAGGEAPGRAIRLAGETLAESLAALGDPILSARAADVRDVAARVARTLAGERLELPERPSIVAADDLPPSVTAEIPAGLLLGIALVGGSATAHAAILAGSLGIPAVVAVDGLGPLLDAEEGSAALAGRHAAVDGSTGELLLDPSDAEERALIERAEAWPSGSRPVPAAPVVGPIRTTDGRRVLLLANIGRPEEAEAALSAGAEGVGLFRTEFLFLGRLRPPTEDEQTGAYRRVFAAFGPARPVVVRLADIGGDKEVPYLGLPPEANPFLGVRGLRLGRHTPDLLVTQLRAVLRAASEAGVVPWVMAPMVATPEDVTLLEELVDAAAVESAPRPKLGVMIEVPSAVVLAPEIARRVEFLSIGTNDLTQYLFAADRTNGRLAGYQDARHPAVLRSVAAVVAAGRAAGIPVAVCGELAGDPDGARLLAGLGVDELSMAPRSIAGVAAAIARSSNADLEREATEAIA